MEHGGVEILSMPGVEEKAFWLPGLEARECPARLMLEVPSLPFAAGQGLDSGQRAVVGDVIQRSFTWLIDTL